MKKFNIRVYGLLLNAQQEVLLVEERHRGHLISKFPGGGLEQGEGVVDCLQREWLEETGVQLTQWQHFYTTEFYQPSAFDPTVQVISIYYRVQAPTVRIVTRAEEHAIVGFRWAAALSLQPEDLTMPIDRVVLAMLQQAIR